MILQSHVCDFVCPGARKNLRQSCILFLFFASVFVSRVLERLRMIQQLHVSDLHIQGVGRTSGDPTVLCLWLSVSRICERFRVISQSHVYDTLCPETVKGFRCITVSCFWLCVSRVWEKLCRRSRCWATWSTTATSRLPTWSSAPSPPWPTGWPSSCAGCPPCVLSASLVTLSRE